MTITTWAGWRDIGALRKLCGHRVFTVDAPPIGPEEHEPLLVLHGFPTSSFDYAAVLDPLRAGRRVLLLDDLGFGLSDKPDLHNSLALQADLAAAFVAALGIGRLAMLTHDMGDTVGGELLARRRDGTWPVEVTRRVLANGSIYIDQARVTDGQQLLLSLPDEKLSPEIPVDAESLTRSLRATFSTRTPLVPEGWADDPLPATVEQILHDDGQLLLASLIRYIDERRRNERRSTGAIESDPSPLHVVWGLTAARRGRLVLLDGYTGADGTSGPVWMVRSRPGTAHHWSGRSTTGAAGPSWITRARRRRSGREISTRNQALSSIAATNLCTPNFIASPLSKVTMKARRSTASQPTPGWTTP